MLFNVIWNDKSRYEKLEDYGRKYSVFIDCNGRVKLLKKEILSVLKDKRTLLIILLIVVLPIIDLSLEYKQMNVAYARKHEKEIIARDLMMKKECEKDGSHYVIEWISHPANASFLASNSKGHTSQVMLLWLLPFFVLNMVSDRYISEKRRGYINVMLSRESKTKYYLTKYFVAFLVPFVVIVVSLLVNFILAQIAFRRGYSFLGLEDLFTIKYGKWLYLEGKYPNLIYLLYIVVTSCLAGMCGLITQSLAFISKRYTITYILGFFIWMWLQTTPYNLTYATQPFIEYGFEDFIKSVMLYVGVGLGISLITFIFKVRQDEL